MKKQLLVCGISILLVTGTAYTLSAQKEKKNDKKEQPAKENKQQGKGNSGNAQNGNGNNKNNGQGNASNHSNGNSDVKQKNGNNSNKGNNGKNGNGNNGKNNPGNDFAEKGKNFNGENYYNWTPDTFKDRKKLKNQDKVSICHKFNNNNEPAVNIRVSSNAAKAHMNHGDVMGECPIANNTNFSDVFLRRRTDYFNTVENSREELSYSRSIYEYALFRLANSRTQLATLQATQLSQAEIDRKQATVVELEQNVSLLETLIGVATNLLVSKL